MNDADTLTRAARLLDNYADVTAYPGIRAEVMDTRAALRAMVARITTDNSATLNNALARIAELEPLQEVVAQLEDEKRVLEQKCDRLQSNLEALEDEKNTYIDYAGDALGQGDDESLWDAAQRVLSERDRLREALSMLVGASSEEDLRSMLNALHQMPISAAERAPLVLAINVLLETGGGLFC